MTSLTCRAERYPDVIYRWKRQKQGISPRWCSNNLNVIVCCKCKTGWNIHIINRCVGINFTLDLNGLHGYLHSWNRLKHVLCYISSWWGTGIFGINLKQDLELWWRLIFLEFLLLHKWHDLRAFANGKNNRVPHSHTEFRVVGGHYHCFIECRREYLLMTSSDVWQIQGLAQYLDRKSEALLTGLCIVSCSVHYTTTYTVREWPNWRIVPSQSVTRGCVKVALFGNQVPFVVELYHRRTWTFITVNLNLVQFGMELAQPWSLVQHLDKKSEVMYIYEVLQP